jgi:DNA-directed RNA polymerase subunit RPC12/RpoP
LNFNIVHPCPRCHHPVTLEETDRMLICPTCRVRVHITSRGPFRYFMEAPESADEVLYIPYWRLKGTIYNAAASFKIDPVVLDSAHSGVSPAFPFKTLSNRSFAQPLRFAARGVFGRFVYPELNLLNALDRMEEAAGGAKDESADSHNFERAYVGEAAGLIFAPVVAEGRELIDPVQNMPLGPALRPEVMRSIWEAPSRAPQWMPRFMASMCPHCGFDLKGDKTAEIFLCRNCNIGWHPRGDEFRPILVRTIPGKGGEMVYLPFWCINAAISGIKLGSYADLIRVANLPRAIKKNWETDDFYFWVPAFKIHPHLFLRVAKQVTISPFLGAMTPNVPEGGAIHPVNIPMVEAFQSLKVVLATFGTPKRTVFQKLPDISIKPQKALLVYVPCTPKGGELIQEELGIAISKQALIYGKDI